MLLFPGRVTSPSQGLIPQQNVAGTHLYTWEKRDKVKLSSLSIKGTTRQANLGPPDPEFEVLTAQPLICLHIYYTRIVLQI